MDDEGIYIYTVKCAFAAIKLRILNVIKWIFQNVRYMEEETMLQLRNAFTYEAK